MARENFIGGAWMPARSGATDAGARARHRRGARRGGVERRGRRRRRGRGRGRRVRRVGGADAARAQRGAAPRSPTRSRPTSTTLSELEMRNVGKPRVDHRLRDGPHASTTGASSPAAPASSKAAPRASTSRTTRRSCAATRSAWSPASRRGTTRSTWPTWKVGPALAAGNTVVLKPSELTPLTALRLAEITADILPPGVLNVVTGQGETRGRRARAHPDVAMVSLTGDVATGKAHRPRRGRLAQAGAPRARRQGAGHRVRRRRRRGAGRDARRDALLQLGPGLHRAVPASSPGPASSTTSSPASPRRSARSRPATRSTPTPRWARSSRPTSSSACAGMVDRAVDGRRRGHGRRQRARPAPASSTSRRSW